MPDYVNVLRLGIGGMVSAADPTLLNEMSYSLGINVAQKNGMICTRPGYVALKAVSDDPGFRSLNIQGAMHYNPAKGQSAQVFANDESSIIVSAGGRKFKIRPTESGKMAIENISGGYVGFEFSHLAYLYQAEVYAICQDGMGATWIYQPGAEPVLSAGYNNVNKEDSRLANGATVGGYIHGRIFQVVAGRRILVGDIIHKDQLTDATNILKTTEQVYWATGAEFSPPSSMGNVLGAAILPLRDTRHGHAGSLMLFCEDGTFSLDLSQYPRSEWSNLALTKHALIDSSARGPYACVPYDGDLLYRSRQGIHSLRSAAAPPRQFGNPDRPVSAAVGDIFRQDRDEFLKFASVSKLAREERMFATTAHVVDGSYRHALATMSFNASPIDAQGESSPAWEGLWVPPPGIGSAVQMVNGIFNGRERCYVLTRDCDGINRVAEMNAASEKDILEDGSMERVKCTLVTRAIVGTKDPLARFSVVNGTVFLRGIRDRVSVRIYYKSRRDQDWILSNEKEIGSDPKDCLTPQGAIEYGMPMGFSNETGNHFQFKIEWDGYLEISAIRAIVSSGDPSDGMDLDSPETHRTEDLCERSIRSMLPSNSCQDANCLK